MNSSANLLFVIYEKKDDDYTPIIYDLTCENRNYTHRDLLKVVTITTTEALLTKL